MGTDRDLGLRKTTLTDDRVPPVFVFTEETPGDTQLLPRSFDGTPPLVPHSLDGLVPITREDNLCLLCHATGSADPGDPPAGTPQPLDRLARGPRSRQRHGRRRELGVHGVPRGAE